MGITCQVIDPLISHSRYQSRSRPIPARYGDIGLRALTWGKPAYLASRRPFAGLLDDDSNNLVDTVQCFACGLAANEVVSRIRAAAPRTQAPWTRSASSRTFCGQIIQSGFQTGRHGWRSSQGLEHRLGARPKRSLPARPVACRGARQRSRRAGCRRAPVQELPAVLHEGID